MINYTPANQLKFENFKTPFEQELDSDNRWVVLASLIPWDELAKKYAKNLSASNGRLSVDIRTIIAAIIVKHIYNLDDRGVIELVRENIYLQYFCGLSSFQKHAIFHPTVFVDIRKRVGIELFDEWNIEVIKEYQKLQANRSRILIKNTSSSKKKQKI